MEQQKPITILEIIMASEQAEQLGVQVDWKRTCLMIVQAMQASEASTDNEDAD
jgi:hypothetical protein